MVIHNYIHKSLIILFLFIIISVQAQTWEDAFKKLGISWNSDGTLNRSQVPVPLLPPMTSQTTRSKDILHPNGELRFRLFAPVNPPSSRIPLIINVHGGNFILYSAASAPYHMFCDRLVAHIPSVVVSVEYPLTPENRLPAAYDAVLSAIDWVLEKWSPQNPDREPWFENLWISNAYLLGSSAGGNIAYRAMINMVALGIHNYLPLYINALILNQPYFGGEQRTPSEIRMEHDEHFPLYMNDMFWKLALPGNANRDHFFSNPVSPGGMYDDFPRYFPRILFKLDEGDPLSDRAYRFAQYLAFNNLGPRAIIRQGYHGIELVNTTAADELFDALRRYIGMYGNTNSPQERWDRHIRLPTERS